MDKNSSYSSQGQGSSWTTHMRKIKLFSFGLFTTDALLCLIRYLAQNESQNLEIWSAMKPEMKKKKGEIFNYSFTVMAIEP